MLQKQDLVLLLTELQDSGVEVTPYLNKVFASPSIPLDVVKFINDQRELSITEFYKHIRKNHNVNKSALYKNIVSDIDDPQEVLTTLASFALQTLLYSKKVDDRQLFLKHARFDEVEKCLLNYSQTYDLIPCLKLIKLIKADLIAIETAYGHR